MYAGKIIEEGTVSDVLNQPIHQYTKGLIQSKPIIGKRVERLYSIDGHVPNLINMKHSCYFSKRCKECREICEGNIPELQVVEGTHKVACFLEEGIVR